MMEPTTLFFLFAIMFLVVIILMLIRIMFDMSGSNHYLTEIRTINEKINRIDLSGPFTYQEVKQHMDDRINELIGQGDNEFFSSIYGDDNHKKLKIKETVYYFQIDLL